MILMDTWSTAYNSLIKGLRVELSDYWVRLIRSSLPGAALNAWFISKTSFIFKIIIFNGICVYVVRVINEFLYICLHMCALTCLHLYSHTCCSRSWHCMACTHFTFDAESLSELGIHFCTWSSWPQSFVSICPVLEKHVSTAKPLFLHGFRDQNSSSQACISDILTTQPFLCLSSWSNHMRMVLVIHS